MLNCTFLKQVFVDVFTEIDSRYALISICSHCIEKYGDFSLYIV